MVLPHARLAPSGIPRNFGPNDSKFPRRVESCFLERPSLKVASTSSKSNRVHFRYCEGFRTWRDVEFESVTSSKADAYKALQFKLIFFVPVDGWSLAAGSLVRRAYAVLSVRTYSMWDELSRCRSFDLPRPRRPR
jgi:hypothetical protein